MALKRKARRARPGCFASMDFGGRQCPFLTQAPNNFQFFPVMSDAGQTFCEKRPKGFFISGLPAMGPRGESGLGTMSPAASRGRSLLCLCLSTEAVCRSGPHRCLPAPYRNETLLGAFDADARMHPGATGGNGAAPT